MDTIKDLIQIFNNSQEVTFDSDNGIKKLRELFKSQQIDSEDTSNLIQGLYHCVSIALTNKNYYRVHFINEFIVKVLIEFNIDEHMSFITEKLLSFLVKKLKANSNKVRERICFIIYSFLSELDLRKEYPADEGLINEQIFFKLQLGLVERLRDINLETQILAIKAASILQTPEDKYCPIINSFLGLLQSESLEEIRILIIEKIVITSHTYRIFKSFLMHDSNSNLQNKVLAEIEKKVPNKYYDVKFKHEIINCLYRNENNALLEKFVLKWCDRLKVNDFLKSIEIRAFYLESDIQQLNTQIEKINSFMVAYFETKKHSILNIIVNLNKVYAEENLEDSFESCVLLFYLFQYCKSHDKMSTLAQHLIIDPKEFEVKIMNKFKTSASKLDSYLLYHLIEICFFLYELNLLEVNDRNLEMFLTMIDLNNESNSCLVKAIVRKMGFKQLSAFIYTLYPTNEREVNKDDQTVMKILTILFFYVERMDEEDFLCSEPIGCIDEDCEPDGPDHELNLIEYFVQRFILKNISNLNPRVRQLCVRVLGLISLISENIAVNYIRLFLQILLHDYPKVVVEAQKALYNIVLTYSSKKNFEEEISTHVIVTLENQLDLINSPEIQFIAIEGFAKLFINNAIFPNKQMILFKLLNEYFSINHKLLGKKSQEQILQLKRTKSCLCSFFNLYSSLNVNNRNTLSEMALPMLKLCIEENRKDLSLKQIAKFFYYFSYNTTYKRQIILKSIVDEVDKNSGDFTTVSKWIEVMIEFNIHSSDINRANILAELHKKLRNIFIEFKKRKWRLTKESELLELIGTIKQFSMNSHLTNLKRKHSNVSISETPIKKGPLSTDLNEL